MKSLDAFRWKCHVPVMRALIWVFGMVQSRFRDRVASPVCSFLVEKSGWLMTRKSDIPVTRAANFGLRKCEKSRFACLLLAACLLKQGF